MLVVKRDWVNINAGSLCIGSKSCNLLNNDLLLTDHVNKITKPEFETLVTVRHSDSDSQFGNGSHFGFVGHSG